jgi:hypothetical protein
VASGAEFGLDLDPVPLKLANQHIRDVKAEARSVWIQRTVSKALKLVEQAVHVFIPDSNPSIDHTEQQMIREAWLHNQADSSIHCKFDRVSKEIQ